MWSIFHLCFVWIAAEVLLRSENRGVAVAGNMTSTHNASQVLLTPSPSCIVSTYCHSNLSTETLNATVSKVSCSLVSSTTCVAISSNHSVLTAHATSSHNASVPLPIPTPIGNRSVDGHSSMSTDFMNTTVNTNVSGSLVTSTTSVALTSNYPVLQSPSPSSCIVSTSCHSNLSTAVAENMTSTQNASQLLLTPSPSCIVSTYCHSNLSTETLNATVSKVSCSIVSRTTCVAISSNHSVLTAHGTTSNNASVPLAILTPIRNGSLDGHSSMSTDILHATLNTNVSCSFVTSTACVALTSNYPGPHKTLVMTRYASSSPVHSISPTAAALETPSPSVLEAIRTTGVVTTGVAQNATSATSTTPSTDSSTVNGPATPSSASSTAIGLPSNHSKQDISSSVLFVVVNQTVASSVVEVSAASPVRVSPTTSMTHHPVVNSTALSVNPTVGSNQLHPSPTATMQTSPASRSQTGTPSDTYSPKNVSQTVPLSPSADGGQTHHISLASSLSEVVRPSQSTSSHIPRFTRTSSQIQRSTRVLSSVSTEESTQSLETSKTSAIPYEVASTIGVTGHASVTPSSPHTTVASHPTATPPGTTTAPPKELNFVKVEMTLDLKFKSEYLDKESVEYKELEKNITGSLEKIYKSMDGFIRIEIIALREGSVICDFIVVMRSDSEVGAQQLKEKLQQESEEGKLAGFKVTNISVQVIGKTETTEKIPQWALTTFIVVACLGGLLLLLVIILAICFYKSKRKRSYPNYYVAEGEGGPSGENIHLDEYKMRASEVNFRKDGATNGAQSNPDFYGRREMDPVV